jgi:molybdopterin/thiamine biosynthesis adenylyltransferase
MNCANSGVVGPVLGVIGSLQATIAIRILLGYFQQHGEMQRYDGKRGQWLTMTSMRDKTCMVCSHEL